jgi:hypothetical protein
VPPTAVFRATEPFFVSESTSSCRALSLGVAQIAVKIAVIPVAAQRGRCIHALQGTNPRFMRVMSEPAFGID